MNIIFSLIIFCNPIYHKMSAELSAQIDGASPVDKIHVVVLMREPYPYAQVEKLPLKIRAKAFKETAARSQAPVIECLRQHPGKVEDIMNFWVYNGFHMSATPDIITNIAGRDDVAFITKYSAVNPDPGDREAPAIRAPEWNIQRVMADSCWSHGYTGDSVIIALIDNEVDTLHPALAGKFTRWYRNFGTPSPPGYHGTYSAGVICGGDGFGPMTNDIGVAPGARLVVAVLGDSGIYDSAMQWIAELKADSGVNIRAVSNAFAWSITYDLTWWGICNTWKSLDILPVFPVGNNGPGSGTACSPGNYPLVLACGCSDQNDNVPSFSSRGPAPDQLPWNDPRYWYRPDWNLIKPDIAAPGMNVRSSAPGGNYVVMGGSAAVCPHAAGAAAILCEVNPGLTVTDLYNLLTDHADRPSPGAPYPNNNYGWGRLNVWHAVQAIFIAEDFKVRPSSPCGLDICPNPFQSRIDIRYKIRGSGPKSFSLKIFDSSGRMVRDLSAGLASCILNHVSAVSWSGDDERGRRLPAGIYFCELKAGGEKAVKKAALLR